MITYQDLIDLYGAERVERGRTFLQSENTLELEVNPDTGVLAGRIYILGEFRPVRVYVRLPPEGADPAGITDDCSCRRAQCSHVTAVLLRALEQDGQAVGMPEPAAVAAAAAGGFLLCYRVQPDREGGGVWVMPCVAAQSGTGFDQPQPLDLQRLDLHGRDPPRGPLPGYVTADDQALLVRLQGFAQSGQIARGAHRLIGPDAASLLHDLLATGRCFHDDPATPLHLGAVRGLGFRWRVDHRGHQSPGWRLAQLGMHIDLGGEHWYLDPDERTCGPADTALPPAFLDWVQGLGPVVPEDAPALQARIDERFPGEPIPRLLRLDDRALPAIRPVPVLRLTDLDSLQDGRRGEAAVLAFDYGGFRITDPQTQVVRDGDTLYRLPRDPGFEEACRGRLRQAELRPLRLVGGGFEGVAFVPDITGSWHRLQINDIPLLRSEGWRVEYDPDFPHRIIRAGTIRADLRQAGEGDWFSFGLGVDVDGDAINLGALLSRLLREESGRYRPETLASYADQDVIVLEVGDGRQIGFPFGRLRPILAVLFELYDGKEQELDEIRMDRVQTFRLADLRRDGPDALDWGGNLETLGLVDRLRGVNEIPSVAPPVDFMASLRDYQHQGLNWLQFLRVNGLAGILADDMGLGKTVQALAHILLEKERGRADRPSLVVAPTSLTSNWRREARQFAPSLRVLTLHGPDRWLRFKEIKEFDLVITTYPLLARDEKELIKHPWHLLILDEAQIIKNPKAKAGRAARHLNARQRIGLTGTPMENHLGELWSLFDFLLPGFLGSERQFRRLFRRPVEQQGDAETGERLARRVRPFLLRRTKEEVVRELPPKTEILRSIELSGPQRDLYEGIRNAVQLRVREEIDRHGLNRSSIVILDALLKLRQVCCDPRLVKLDQARRVPHSAKLDMLMELLPEMIEEGRRVLIFSQFAEMLALIEEAVKGVNIPYAKLTGVTKDRAEQVARFQDGHVPLFLITLKAGGVGLNLTAADTVIHYDPWWNPAAERQATDRAHRIGQDKPVFVYKLITEGTVEEKILALQARKQALADAMLDRPGGSAPRWTEEDLDMLFEPLN